MPLTAAKIRSAEARARPYKVADGQGLFLHVAPTGTKTLRFAYRFGGREKLLVLGRAPALSLADARAARDDARQALRQGRDPSAGTPAPAAEPANDTGPLFAPFARGWLAAEAPSWSTAHAADVAAQLERDVFPAIGAAPIATIDRPTVLAVVRAVESRGSIETARRLRQRLDAILARAEAEGLVDANPAARVTKALRRPAAAVHHPAALTIADARAAIAAIAAAPSSAAAQLASTFLALTAVRWAVVRGARWEEIEDLDGPAPLWRVPAARMKLRQDAKADAGNDHLVPLSPAAVAVLRQAAGTSSGPSCGPTSAPAGLIFPGRPGRPLGENVLDQLYARAGLAGRHVPHGWRASWSTILVEARPADRAAIDLALGHVPGSADGAPGERMSKVEAAYNRAQLLSTRRDLFTAWGNWLVGGEEPPVALGPAAA